MHQQCPTNDQGIPKDPMSNDEERTSPRSSLLISPLSFPGHWWGIAGAFVILLLPAAVYGHPGLDLAHDRTAAVKLTPRGVRVEYRLEVHVSTAVRLEVPNLVDDLTT